MSFLQILFICLLSITDAEYPEQKLISGLNNFYNFDHNIFLFDSSADIDCFIGTTRGPGHFTPQTLYVFKSANDNITGLESLKKIASKTTFVIIVPGSAKFKNNLNLLTRVKGIQRLERNMKIGIFFPHNDSSEGLHDLFEWSWKNRITNILAATQSESFQGLKPKHLLHIFTYNPFGAFDVINVTDSQSYDKYFLSQNTNFQQYLLIKEPTYFDTLDKEFWTVALDVINASIKENDDYTYDENAFYIKGRRGILTYEGGRQLHSWNQFSNVIIVPEALPYSQFTAYLKAVTTDMVLGYYFITVAVVIVFLIFFRFKRQRKFLIFDSVADVVNLLMNDNGYIKYRQLSGIEALLIVPLTFAGLIIVNGILSALLSYMTRPMLQPQIDTLEDIYRSPFPICTFQKILANMLNASLSSQSDHNNWTGKISVEKEIFLREQIFAFNGSICFEQHVGYGKTLSRAQKRLNVYGYHISQVHTSTMHSAFTIDTDFPFIERLNEIIHRLYSSGLYDLWQKEADISFENYIVDFNLERVENIETEIIDNDSVEMPTFILYGWSASITVFIIELIWKKVKIFLNRILRKVFCKICFDNNLV